MNHTEIRERLSELNLSTMAHLFEKVAEDAAKENWTMERYLGELASLECEERHQRRISRNLRASLLPPEKTFSQANPKLWPGLNIAKVKKMAQGDFLDSATNLILIGKPGTGKTYIMAAVGHELVRAGRRVLFTKAQTLIEGLLTAKKDLELAKYLKKLDGFDCLMIDDIGYVPKESDETEVLFHLFNERYERRSLAITSNLVFSQWEKIFKDKMTTVAAVDRIVHHSIIIDCKWPSIRAAEAKMAHHNGQKEEKNVDANA